MGKFDSSCLNCERSDELGELMNFRGERMNSKMNSMCGKPDTCMLDEQPVADLFLEMHVPATVMGGIIFLR